MIIDLITECSKTETAGSKSSVKQTAAGFADKLAAAKLQLQCRALKNLQKADFQQRQLQHKQQQEIDRQETEHIRFVKYVNNRELQRGLTKQAMFM